MRLALAAARCSCAARRTRSRLRPSGARLTCRTEGRGRLEGLPLHQGAEGTGEGGRRPAVRRRAQTWSPRPPCDDAELIVKPEAAAPHEGGHGSDCRCALLVYEGYGAGRFRLTRLDQVRSCVAEVNVASRRSTSPPSWTSASSSPSTTPAMASPALLWRLQRPKRDRRPVLGRRSGANTSRNR